jgi:hypothetical protein
MPSEPNGPKYARGSIKSKSNPQYPSMTGRSISFSLPRRKGKTLGGFGFACRGG